MSRPAPEPSSTVVFPLSSRPLPWLWLLFIAAVAVLGFLVPRWRPLESQALSQRLAADQMSAKAAAPAEPSRLESLAGIVLLLWLVAVLAVVGRLAWRRRQAPSTHPQAVSAELPLAGGCWLQLVRFGSRRLVVGGDRGGARCLVELPPAPEEPTTARPGPGAGGTAGDAGERCEGESVGRVERASGLSPQGVAILDLFQQLRAATQAAPAPMQPPRGQLP